MANDHDNTCCDHCGLPVPAARLSHDHAQQFCCFGCRLVFGLNQAGSQDNSPATGTFLLRLGLGIFLTMNLMVFNWFFYSQHVYGTATNDVGTTGSLLQSVFAYLMLALCTLVVVLVGSPIAADVIDRLRRSKGRSFDMNLLIILGVGASYIISAIHTFQGHGDLYFDTAAVILVLVTLGGYLDARAKQQATCAGNELLDLLPRTVRVQRDGVVNEIDASEVKRGDRVQACPGERIAVDGIVDEGASDVIESAITGESKPRSVCAGDAVMAGAIAADGQLWITAQRVGKNRLIEQIKQMLDDARQHQPRIQRLADRVATIFIPIVMLLAVIVFAAVSSADGMEAGLLRAMSVLLISCPCALGLAAPLATSTAMARAARRGILFKAALVLEQAANVGKVFFDKTGTLTEPSLTVESIEPRKGCDVARALHVAASIESGSNHPVARSLCEAASKRGVQVDVPSNVQVLPGQGIAATLDGHQYHIGNLAMLRAHEVNVPNDESNGCIVVYLLDEVGVMCVFQLTEIIKPNARQTLEGVRQLGCTIEVLTGDMQGPSRKLADALNVTVHAQLLPSEKLKHIAAAQKPHDSRHVVAFVGDGINDAPALATADVGISVDGATNLATQAGDVHLIGRDIDAVPQVFGIARHAVQRIKINLLWAFGYNSVGITLAAAGFLSPVVAAVLMVASSLLIVATSRQAGDIADADQTVESVAKSGPIPIRTSGLETTPLT